MAEDVNDQPVDEEEDEEQSSDQQQILDDLTVLGEGEAAEDDAERQIRFGGETEEAEDQTQFFGTIHTGSIQTQDEVEAGLPPQGQVPIPESEITTTDEDIDGDSEGDVAPPEYQQEYGDEPSAPAGPDGPGAPPPGAELQVEEEQAAEEEGQQSEDDGGDGGTEEFFAAAAPAVAPVTPTPADTPTEATTASEPTEPTIVTVPETPTVPDVPTVPVDAGDIDVTGAAGLEDTSIPLSITLPDGADPDTASVTLSNIPAGAVLTSGGVEIDTSGGSVTLSGSQLADLAITPPDDSSANIPLDVSVDLGDGSEAQTAQLLVDVAPDADAPTLELIDTPTPPTGLEDGGAISLGGIDAGFTDADGSESVSVSISGIPDGAVITVDGTPLDVVDGVVTLPSEDTANLAITPPPDYSGNIVLTITATVIDDDPDSDATDQAETSRSLTVTIDPQADPATIDVVEARGDEDTAIELDIDVTAGDSDSVENITEIVISGVGDAELSAGVDNGDGTWTLSTVDLEGLTITPPPNSDADIELTIAVTTQDGDSTTTTTQGYTVTVDAVADAPTLDAPDAVTAGPSQAVDLDIVSALTDTDGSESLSITIGNIPDGAVLASGGTPIAIEDGQATLTQAQLAGLTFTPPADDPGPFSLSVTSTSTEDDGGDQASVSDTIAITVRPDGIVVVDDAAGLEDAAIPLSISLPDDADPSATLVTLTGIPDGATLTSGEIEFVITENKVTLSGEQLADLRITPPADSADDFTLGVSVDLGDGTPAQTADLLVDVTPDADAPSLTVSDPETGAVNQPVALDIVSGLTDTDGSETLSITIGNIPDGAVLTSAGTPISVVDGQATLTPSQLADLTFTPPAGGLGPYELSVTATAEEQENQDQESATGSITVTVGNDGSVSIDAAAGVEDTAIPLSITVPDVEGAATTVTLDNIPVGTTFSYVDAGGETVVIDPDGADSIELDPEQLNGLTITPPDDSDVDFALGVSVAQDGVVIASDTLDVSVAADADAPTLMFDPTVSGEQATPIPLDVSSALTDLDGSESLSVTFSGLPAGATLSAGAQTGTDLDTGNVTWTISAEDFAADPNLLQTLTVTPPPNYVGDFDLTVTSTATEADGGDQESVSGVINVVVDAEATEPSGPTGDADTPSLSSDSVTGAEDNWIGLDISAGLTDETETLSLTLGDIPADAKFSYVDAQGETVVIDPEGASSIELDPEQLNGLSILPPPDYFGDFNLTVTATSTDIDDDASITQTFGVTVTPVLDNPEITPGTVTGGENAPIPLDVNVEMANTTVDLDTFIFSNIPDGAQLFYDPTGAGSDDALEQLDVLNGFLSLSRDQAAAIFPDVEEGVDSFDVLLANLFIKAPDGFEGDFDLTMTAVSADGGVDVETYTVTVEPTFEAEDITGIEDQTGGIALNIDAGGNAEVTISGLPEGATLSAGVFSDGSWTVAAEDLDNLKLILPEDLAGTFNITVTGGDDTATFAVNVDEVADAPSIEVALAEGTEDTAIALDIDVGLNDTDGSETITSVTISGVPEGAVLSAGIDNQDGTWTLTRGELDGLTITPPVDFNGQIELGVTAVSTETASGDTAASTTTLTVDVANVNDGPVAQAEAVSATENGAVVTGQLDATDVDGDTLTYTLVDGLEAEQGTLTLNADGSYSYDPGEDFQGLAAGEEQELTFTYQVDDGQGGTSTAVGTITVTGTNDGPTANVDTLESTEDTILNFTAGDLLGNDTDIDGDTLSIVAFEQPDGGTVVQNPNGSFTFTPDENFNGETTFTYTISDGQGGTSTATVTLDIEGVNDAPVAEDEAIAVTEDDPTAVAGQLDATDVDGDNLQYQLLETPSEGNLTFNSDGTYTFDPGDDFQDLGIDETREVTFDYEVRDGHGGVDTATITITVTGTNDGPVATDDTLNAVEDTVLNISVDQLLGNDIDVDGDTLSIIDYGQPDGGTVTRNDDGSFTFTPNPDFSGQTTFTYVVEDPSGETSTATVTLNVAATADGVDLTVQPATGDEDTSIPLNIAVTEEAGGETLSVIVDGIPSGSVLTYVDGNGETQTISFGGTSATLTPAQLNGLAITPPEDSDADFTLTVTAISQDGDETATVSQDLHVTVDAVADAPEVTAAAVSGNEDAAIPLDLSAGLTDIDGSESLTVSLSGIPEGAVLTAGGEPLTVVDGAVELTQAQLGTLAITPAEDFNGSFDLTLTATSEEAIGGDTAVSSQVFTVTVGDANDGPVAVDDAASTGEDSAVTINVLGNDTDADGDTLSVTAVSLPDGIDGTVGINPDGSITFTPGDGFDALADNETQQVEITYTISDGQGGTSTATATVTVTGSNDGPMASDDSLSGDEDQTINFTAQDLLGNDTDAEGDALSILNFDQPEHGTVVQNDDGTFTFTPDDDFSGQTTFTYTVADPLGETSTATVTIDVTSDNDGPIAVADQLSVNEDGDAQGVDVLGNDSDPDGGTLSLSNVAMPEGIPGTMTIDNHGAVVYDPEDNYQDLGVGESTSFDVTYTISDGQGGTSAAAVTVTVHGTNDGPQAETVELAATEDGAAVSGQLEASDIDGDTLTFALVEGPSEGTVTIGTDGAYTFTPGTDFQDLGVDESREVTFTYQVDDGHGGVSTAVGTVTVTGTNDGPQAQADTLLAEEDGGAVSVNVLGNDTDADGDTLTVTGAALPAGVPGTLEYAEDGTISYDPGTAFQDLGVGESTSFDVTYTISDGQGGTSESTVTITVEGTNDGPQAQAESVLADEDGVVVSGQLDATDVDGDNLTFSLVDGLGDNEGTLTLNADGSYSYDPGQNFQHLAEGETQELTFTYQVDDGQDGTSTAIGTITIEGHNDGPQAQVDTLAASEDGGTVTVDVLANDTDADGDSLSITSATLPDGIPGTVNYDENGNITYHPGDGFQELAAGEETSFDITYTISDGQGGTSEATVTVTITGSNDGPKAQAETVALGEDAEPVTGQLTATDVDTPTENLAFSLVDAPAEGTLEIAADGSYTFTPGDAFQDLAAGETQELTFTYQVDDGQGGTSTAVGTITVTGSNDGPQAEVDTLDATENGGAVTVDVLANDTDVDGDSLSITSATLPDGIPGTVNYDEDGNITYNPGDGFQELAAGEETSFDVTYTISDGQGGISEATVTITVTGTNDGPEAQAEAVAATENGGAVSGQLDATDVDGDNLTFSLIDGLGDGEGTLTLNADGSYSYDPGQNFQDLAAGETQELTFTYQVDDGQGGTSTAVGTITIEGTNDGPVATADSLSGTEDQTISFTAADLLGNDTDVDGDTLTISSFEQPDGGTVTENPDGTFTFTPDENFNGETSFTYTISDGQGGSSTATVTIDVEGVNDDPVAEDETVAAQENGGAVSGQLDATDVDGDSLTFALAEGPSEGTVTVNADGSYSFNPGEGFQDLGDDETREVTFTYEVSDGQGGTSTATATVTVTGSNDGPIANADTLAATEDGGAVEVNVLGNDTDAEGDTLTVTGATLPDGVPGTLDFEADGTISYDPGTAFQELGVGESTSFDVTYTISDGQGGTSESTVTITVDGTNDGPQAQAESVSATEDGGAVTGQLDATDVDGDDLTFSLVEGTTEGTVTVNADGSFSFTPGDDFQDLGVDETREVTFTYQVSDGEGGMATAVGTVTVTGTNDGPEAQAESVSASENGGAVAGQLDATDADGDSLTFALVEGPSEGSVTVNADGSYSFDPGDGFQDLGVDESREVTFTYEVSDGKGGTSTAVGTVTVTGSNDGPVASADTLSGTEDQPVSFTAADLLGNDTDADGDALTITAFDQPDGGTVTQNPDGSFTFTPDENFSGETSFTYTVSDGEGGTSTATVTIDVEGVADAPTFAIADRTGSEDTAIALDIDIGLADASETLTITLDGIPAGAVLASGGEPIAVENGSATLTQDQLETLTITPPEDSNVDFQLIVTAASQDGDDVNTVTGTIDVDVTGVADAPTLTASIGDGTVEGGATAVEVSQATIDAANAEDDRTVVVSGVPEGATLSGGTDNGDGTWTLSGGDLADLTVTPADGSIDDISLSFSVVDPGGSSVNVLSADFNSGNDGFSYSDDTFNDTNAGSYATGGEYGGALYVGLGGKDDHDISGMSGGHSTSFTVDDSGSGTLTFSYRLWMDNEYESNEYSQVIVEIDGQRVELDGNDFITQLNGGGDTGWQTVTIDVGDLGEGAHTITFGGYNNEKTTSDEQTFVQFDNISLDVESDETVVATETVEVSPDAAMVAFDLDVASSLLDTDGSESLTVTLDGLPDGAVLFAGDTEIAVENGSATLTSSQLGDLTLKVPEGSDDFDLAVTATATENDGDTATTSTTLSVDVPVSDMDADGATIDTTDAAGIEDNAIALDIDVTMADGDGSETVSITISGVPDGAMLSAGTDNNDGTWTLTEEDLAGLSITPPDDSNQDFTLTITAVTTETASGETSSVSTTLDVDLTGDADAPSLTASLGEPTVSTADGEEVGVSIDCDSFTDTDNGFTVTGRSVNSDGSLSEASADNLTYNSSPGGFGVAGTASGADSELGYDDDSNTSEQIVVSFDDDISSADVSFAWLSSSEEATYEIYRDGVKVGEGTVQGVTDNVDSAVTLTADDGGSFDQIVFSAPGHEDDYLIHSIDFTRVEGGETTVEYPLNISSALADTDGSETLTITVSDLPDGAVLSAGTDNGDGTWTLAASDLDGLTVTLSGDDPGQAFDFTVIATATENDGDIASVSTTLTSAGVDLDTTVDGASIDAADATGNEDAAIALDIDVTMLDSDGSESVTAITLSGVPDGAALSAGTDNGDGTWTLDSGDLEGLTITPPADSNTDFQLTVSVTVEEENGGATSTTSTTLDVDVTGVADAPTLTVDVGEGTATSNPGMTPVAYWNVDETSGLTLNDQIGDYDGKSYGKSSSKNYLDLDDGGQFGTAAEFKSSDDQYIKVDHSPDLKPDSGALTLWFNADKVSGSGRYTLASSDSSGYDDGGHFGLYIEDGQLKLRMQGESDDTTIAGGDVDKNEWNQVTVTWGEGGAKIYLNGELVASDPDWTRGLSGNENPWTFGADQSYSGDNTANNLRDYFDGHMDDIALYDHQPTDAQVAALFNDGVQDVMEADTGGSDGVVYPVTITTALADADGSESLSVTITGLPSGATLSAGTDNGDGTWTLDSDALDNLTIAVPPGSDTFNLAVTATATEDDGDTRSVSSTVSVEAPEGDPIERPDSFDHTGTAGGDTISGGDGQDAIDGGDGNDVIYGDKSWDTGSAAGDDVIFAGDGNDYVEGGGGDDQIAGEAGDDILIGDHYWDTSNAGDDTIDGGAGNDTIGGGDGDDHLYGGDGNDLIYGDLAWQTGSGAGDDVIDGGAGNDTIYGGEGADQIDGGAGNDVIYGDLDYGNSHDGGDTIDGGAGDDTIYGGAGNDTLTGGEGSDDVYGGDGNDLFIFGAGDGADYFHGGDGWSDTIQLDGVDSGPGGDSGWTLQLDDGASWTETETGIEFGGEVSGKIELADGSELIFEGVEKLEW